MARQAGKTVPVHFKMDTGMGRLGPRWEDAPSMILEITGLKNVSLEGLFSHFPSADLLDDFSLEQIERFKNVAKAVEEKKVFIPFKHISNSSGIIAYNDPYFNLVRPGIVLYGTAPSAVMEERILPRPVFHWKTRILEIKNFKPGDTVSYGRTYTVKEPTRAAVIPLGYADGFLTLNSNNGTVIIGEKPCAILGRVCMDYFVVDLKNVPEAEVEDEVSVYGDFDEIRPMDIAKRTGLIPYEILTNVNQSTPRIYLKGE
jgi:alanine racemase